MTRNRSRKFYIRLHSEHLWVSRHHVRPAIVSAEYLMGPEKRTSPSDSTDARDSEGEKRVSFSLEHLEGVFIMYGVGCGLSLLAFACELPFTRVT
ncbi:hypothetical protein E2C01_022262 [Portunus trituberculatus]|uniref:Uncharacterized protein n=1 Tax=Portunus trituberculatus TaxID=210409 RepID=A0A5B7E6T5_PORTR|nr:hypothetical protein [Portunus trituberculatus]